MFCLCIGGLEMAQVSQSDDFYLWHSMAYLYMAAATYIYS
jgi:hypothetical protein